MSGKWNGLQARIKEINQNDVFVPRFADTLNLIGKCAAECNKEAVIFFFLYIFFVYINLCTFFCCITSLGFFCFGVAFTRFPLFGGKTALRHKAQSDALKALLCRYLIIKQVLEDFSNNADKKAISRSQANGLHLGLKKSETGILIVMWF